MREKRILCGIFLLALLAGVGCGKTEEIDDYATNAGYEITTEEAGESNSEETEEETDDATVGIPKDEVKVDRLKVEGDSLEVKAEEADTYNCDVVGSTCMEKDVMLKEVTMPRMEAGDFIQFNGVGAYTICLTPTFINFLEPILMPENGEWIEARRRQTVEDIVGVYRL